MVAAGQQAAGCGHSLLGGIGPVLDPDVGAEALVEPTGHVSRHHHVVGGVQRGVGHDTVVHLEPRTVQPLGGGHHSDPDDHHVGVDRRSVIELDSLDLGTTTRRAQRRNTDPGEELDAVVGVQRCARRAHLVAEHAGQRLGQGLDHGHGRAQSTARGGHLGPDEARPHHDDADTLDSRGPPEVEGVLQSPQGVHTRQRRGPGQGTRVGAGGDHQSVEAQRGAVVELERVPVDVEPPGPVSEAQIESESGDLLRRPQHDSIEPPRAGQELLGQRGAVVRQMGLGTDQHHGARVPLGTQGLGGPQTGEGCADDGDGRARVKHHGRTRP